MFNLRGMQGQRKTISKQNLQHFLVLRAASQTQFKEAKTMSKSFRKSKQGQKSIYNDIPF